MPPSLPFGPPFPYVLLWITLVSAAALLSYGMAAKYLALPEPQPSIQYWQRMFAGIEAAQGLSWALSALMLGGVEDPAARLFLLMVLLLAGAMNTMLSSAQPAAVYAGLAPVSLTIILFAFVSHQRGTTPLMILSAIAMICLIILARRLYTNALAAMILRKEKEPTDRRARTRKGELRRGAATRGRSEPRQIALSGHDEP